MKILLRRIAFAGDVLLTTGAASAVKQKYGPDSEVSYLTESRYREILYGNPNIDRILPGVLGEQYDVEINFSHEDYAGGRKQWQKIYCEQAYVDESNFRQKMYLMPVELEYGMYFHEYVAIAGFSGLGKNFREWDVDSWNEVIEKLGKYKIVQIGTFSEPRIKGTYDLRGSTTLRQSAAIIKYCKLLLCIDSYPMHCAYMWQTPFVALFGPTRPESYLDDDENVIQHYPHDPCPCGTTYGDKECVYHRQCMRAIGVDEVVERVEGLLNG